MESKEILKQFNEYLNKERNTYTDCLGNSTIGSEDWHWWKAKQEVINDAKSYLANLLLED